METELILLAKEAGTAGVVTLVVLTSLWRFLKPLRDAAVKWLEAQVKEDDDA